MFDIHVFGSSSKGNCIFVNTGDCKFLLDAGLSVRETTKSLANINEMVSSLDYIFITHEHIDHIRALEKIVDKYETKIISSHGTLYGLDISEDQKLTMKSDDILHLENITVKAKRVNHDAMEPLCFAITNSLGEKLLYLTDCGSARYMHFEDFDVYIIEANYDLEILKRNYETGILHRVQYERATSGMGHLNIEECIEFLENNIGTKTKHIILSHLSPSNSNKQKFKERVEQQLFFFDVHIAEKSLNIKCGDNPQPF